MNTVAVLLVLGTTVVACSSASDLAPDDGEASQALLHPRGTGGKRGLGTGGATGAMCTADRDCPVLAICRLCPDGSCANPNVHCVNGSCSPPNYTCPSGAGGGGSGGTAECKSASECVAPHICKACSDGVSYSCARADCQDGKCVTAFPPCPAPTSLSWFLTCGLPVCRASGAADSTDRGNAAGNASSLAACDPANGQKVGAPCELEGQTCDPGASCGEKLLCTTSDPTHGGICPISRAKYKEDIEYVSAAERAKLASDVQSIPLVRYRYKDAPEREHLGFIIEDVEPSPSIDSKRDQVDLYGYTSMAVAALQQQQQQITELRREVQSLKSRPRCK